MYPGNKKEKDPVQQMQLLARSGGERATDDLYVFAHPEINHQGEMEMFFLSNGLRYLSPESLKRIEQLITGDQLALRRETENEHNCIASLLETGEQIKVGYCPRYLSRDLCKIIDKTTVKLTVERLNHDAPIQFRLLCKAVFSLPTELSLFSGSEYQTLDSELIAA